MSVFRVEKTSDYTVMSNYHLRDKSISLKAKGLLSLMLSLPEDWDYTMLGLAHISKEGVCSIQTGIDELELAGYVVHGRARNARGQLKGTEYHPCRQRGQIHGPRAEKRHREIQPAKTRPQAEQSASRENRARFHEGAPEAIRRTPQRDNRR